MGQVDKLNLATLAICTSLGACDPKPPVLYLAADLPAERFQEAQNVVQEVADSRGLLRAEDPRFAGRAMTFFAPDAGKMHRDTPVLHVGFPTMTRLTILAYESPGLSAREAERLAAELKEALTSWLALDFCKGGVDQHAGWCEARPNPRLMYLADADPFRHAEDRGWLGSLRRALGGGEASVDDLGYVIVDRHAGGKLDGPNGSFQLLIAYDARASRRGEHTLALTNATLEGALTLTVYDQGGMPLTEADALARRAKKVLTERFGVSLCRANPATAVCDERHAKLEAEREAWLAARETNLAEDVEAFVAERPESPYADEARERLSRLRALAEPPPPRPPSEPVQWWGGRKAGETFADALDVGGTGPKLIVVASGAFRMGCVSGVACRESELPVREVRIARPFALARSETTYADYQRFTQPDLPARTNWAQNPAVHLTWAEALAYAEWLSARTGERYRLPSEAEWERAARAGLEAPFVWGDELDRAPRFHWFAGVENDLWGAGVEQDLRGRRRSTARCLGCPGQGDTRAAWSAAVGAYPPNAWGFFEMAGNAAEWMADCWQEDHLRAPADGAARTDGDCSRRVVRGGSHAQTVLWARPAARAGRPADQRYLDVGFRVLRELRDGE